jgi:hypothetical protein
VGRPNQAKVLFSAGDRIPNSVAIVSVIQNADVNAIEFFGVRFFVHLWSIAGSIFFKPLPVCFLF